MKEKDKVWLACAIDCEGTIGYYKGGRLADGEARYHVRCLIATMNRSFIAKCAQLMGTKVLAQVKKAKGQRTQGSTYTMYMASVSHLKAYKVIKAILPYLIIKAEKAQVLCEAYELGVIPSHAFPQHEPSQLLLPYVDSKGRLEMSALGLPYQRPEERG